MPGTLAGIRKEIAVMANRFQATTRHSSQTDAQQRLCSLLNELPPGLPVSRINWFDMRDEETEIVVDMEPGSKARSILQNRAWRKSNTSGFLCADGPIDGT